MATPAQSRTVRPRVGVRSSRSTARQAPRQVRRNRRTCRVSTGRTSSSTPHPAPDVARRSDTATCSARYARTAASISSSPSSDRPATTGGATRLTSHRLDRLLRVARLELEIVGVGQLAGLSVELDLAQRRHRFFALGAAGRRRAPHWCRSRRNEEQRIQHERERADSEQRSSDQRPDHASPSPFTAASRRASSSGVASTPGTARGE